MLRDAALDLNPAELQSRRRWAKAMACVFMARGMETVHAVVAAGRDEFERQARPELSQHAFKQEDYHLMFQVLQQSARENRDIGVEVMGGHAGYRF